MPPHSSSSNYGLHCNQRAVVILSLQLPQALSLVGSLNQTREPKSSPLVLLPYSILFFPLRLLFPSTLHFIIFRMEAHHRFPLQYWTATFHKCFYLRILYHFTGRIGGRALIIWLLKKVLRRHFGSPRIHIVRFMFVGVRSVSWKAKPIATQAPHDAL